MSSPVTRFDLMAAERRKQTAEKESLKSQWTTEDALVGAYTSEHAHNRIKWTGINPDGTTNVVKVAARDGLTGTETCDMYDNEGYMDDGWCFAQKAGVSEAEYQARIARGFEVVHALDKGKIGALDCTKVEQRVLAHWQKHGIDTVRCVDKSCTQMLMKIKEI